jgi:tripartite-type tricarboxylate transporter receptor subunit TctC
LHPQLGVRAEGHADRIATIVKALRAVFDMPEMEREFERWSTQPTFLEGAEPAQPIAAEDKVFQSLADAVPM